MLVQFCEEYEQLSKDIRQRSEGPSTVVTIMTLSTGAGAVDAVDEVSEAGAVVSEVGLGARADDEVAEAATAEAGVSLGARAISAVSRSQRPELQRPRLVSRPG